MNRVCEQADMMDYERWIDRMDRLLAKDVELRLWALENHLLIMAGMAALLLPFIWYCFS